MIVAAILVGYFLAGLYGARLAYAYGRRTGEPKFCPEPNSKLHRHSDFCYEWDGVAKFLSCLGMLLAWPLVLFSVSVVAAITCRPHEFKAERLARRERELKAAHRELETANEKLRELGIRYR